MMQRIPRKTAIATIYIPGCLLSPESPVNKMINPQTNKTVAINATTSKAPITVLLLNNALMLQVRHFLLLL